MRSLFFTNGLSALTIDNERRMSAADAFIEEVVAGSHAARSRVHGERHWLRVAVAGGAVSADPTVACCLDADRLDGWRLGTEPDPERLSTDAGKELIEWAGGELQAMAVSWAEVIERVLAKGVVSE